MVGESGGVVSGGVAWVVAGDVMGWSLFSWWTTTPDSPTNALSPKPTTTQSLGPTPAPDGLGPLRCVSRQKHDLESIIFFHEFHDLSVSMQPRITQHHHDIPRNSSQYAFKKCFEAQTVHRISRRLREHFAIPRNSTNHVQPRSFPVRTHHRCHTFQTPRVRDAS